MFYVPLEDEVDTLPLMKAVLKQGRCVVVPFVHQRKREVRAARIFDVHSDLIKGCCGVREPLRRLRKQFGLTHIDLVLVPGIGFDKKGYRLGRGKGYYDRFLRVLPTRVKRYGLAFDVQMVESIPRTKTDLPVDRVITNS